MLQKFESSEYAQNQVNRAAFYLGALCSEAYRQNADQYIGKVLKVKKNEFHNVEQMKELHVAVERILQPGTVENVRKLAAETMLQLTSDEWPENGNEQLCYGMGLSGPGDMLGKC